MTDVSHRRPETAFAGCAQLTALTPELKRWRSAVISLRSSDDVAGGRGGNAWPLDALMISDAAPTHVSQI
jgi:hypothetical protein